MFYIYDKCLFVSFETLFYFHHRQSIVTFSLLKNSFHYLDGVLFMSLGFSVNDCFHSFVSGGKFFKYYTILHLNSWRKKNRFWWLKVKVSDFTAMFLVLRIHTLILTLTDDIKNQLLKNQDCNILTKTRCDESIFPIWKAN